MSKPYRTFKKEKWIFFALSIIVYFVPFVIVTACVFPLMRKADTGYRVALGILIVIINALPFLMGIFKSFFAHFPMLNIFAIGFCILGALFTFNIFAEYIDKFLWIECAAALGSVAACVFWGLHRKYARYAESIKANVLSGAFEAKSKE
ncbi:MAG: hypothetical protein K2N30_03355 [Clostridia bacterium]|nr:hypothetical protein [Clostridia bacterium]